MSLDEPVVDLEELLEHRAQDCGATRRAFCLAAGASLVAGAGLISLGCTPESNPRIGTGGIDNQPGPTPPTLPTQDMAHSSSTTGGTPDMARSTTSGGATGSGTTGSGNVSCPNGMIAAGAVSAVPQGKATRVRSGSLDAWLCHDAAGYYALDNYCPHRGCAVSFQSNSSFYCPCHGATFDFNGARTNRVSPAPMDHLALCVDSAGNAYVDPNATVDATTRAS